MESGIAEIETHGAQGVRERVGFRHEDAWALASVTADEHGCGTVAEQD